MAQVPKFDRHGHRPRVGPMVLPAEGRQGEPPTWPIPGRMTQAQEQAWAALWATPQAVAWEAMGCTRTIARYTRLLVACERPGATAAVHAQATALEDRLGLSPKAMRMLLWTVAPAATPEPDAGEDEHTAELRRRLRIVGDDQGA
jgi:hypothetical protein